MLESATLIVFSGMLVASIVYHLPLLGVLLMGWLLFFDYGLMRGYDMGELVRMSLDGMRDVVPVLGLFALIGALTAAWRAAGVIPLITCWSVRAVTPATLVPTTFLLCCALSLLTGSSFAAAATMGVICMTVARSLGANELLVGGAVISGSFLGDQCSPMSSSAALVAHITKTELLSNVARMVRTGVVPIVATFALYAVIGVRAAGAAEVPAEIASGVTQAFRSFELSPVVLTPVALVLVLCLAHVRVRVTMLASLACSVALCLWLQGMDPLALVRVLLLGYRAADPALARLANGGGVTSMAEIAAVVTVASTYAGLFRGTGLLEGLKAQVTRLSLCTTPFVGILLTSVVTTAVACDQVVSIMLVRELCSDCERDSSALALDLETSVTLMPALIPWSTSCVGIVAFTGMPAASVACAFLPMLVPLWLLLISLWQHDHPGFVDCEVAHALGLTEADDMRRPLAA